MSLNSARRCQAELAESYVGLGKSKLLVAIIITCGGYAV